MGSLSACQSKSSSLLIVASLICLVVLEDQGRLLSGSVFTAARFFACLLRRSLRERGSIVRCAVEGQRLRLKSPARYAGDGLLHIAPQWKCSTCAVALGNAGCA